MRIENLTADGKVAYLIKPILNVLQEAGGQLDRSDIKEKISELDEEIAEYSQTIKKSKSTGNEYKEFNFKFNFAIKDLAFLDLVTFTKGNPVITLTDKGLNLDINKLDVDKEIMEPAKVFWQEKSENNKKNKQSALSEENSEGSDATETVADDFEVKLLNAIANMSPKKFEVFSRALLTKMGVEFTDKGVQVSGDGGIDGYGYHVDQNDFRTTRVVIQCKRYNAGSVGEPQINEFLGAMNKYKADYGVFITNGRYTKAARDAAKEGSPITLIDGNDLVRLVIKYELYITPVKTYILDDFYGTD